MKKIALFFCFSLLLVIVSAQKTIYVKQDATTGQQNGTSWADAFTDLQDALSIAFYNDQIWVAAGTYYPTTSIDRTISFQLKNGVALLGGFNGTETDSSERNALLNLTRLSGNIGDTSTFSDNSLHVARGKGLDEHTLIDGLIFSDGYSVGVYDSPSDPDGAGLYLTGSTDLLNSRPTISSCLFEKNWAGGAGGALFIGWVDLDDPFQTENMMNPVLKNCIFKENKAGVFGGAILKQGPTGDTDTFQLEHCHFIGNYVYAYDGGAIYFPSALNSTILMNNCVFEQNTSFGGTGGGFFLPNFNPGGYTTSVILNKCIFSENNATEGGGFSINGRISVTPDVTMNLSITDCWFDGNISRNDYGSAFIVTHERNGIVNAVINGSKFTKNSAKGYFTAAILGYDECTINASLQNCSFLENVDIENPNSYCAAFSAGGTKKVATRINNCIFAYNGAAIFSGGGEFSQVTTDITNCTFYRNGDQPFGKRWYPSFNQPGAQFYNNMTFKNCAIWEPVENNSYLFYNNYPDIITGFGFFLDYCSLHPLVPAVIPNHLTVLGDSIFIGMYPQFKDTSGMDFRINKCSPTINRGFNDAAFNANLTKDYDGNPRIRFGRVDLGAFEQQDSCFTSMVINPVSLRSLVIAPNPSTSSELSFQLPDVEDKRGRVTVFNQNGKVAYQETRQLEHINQLLLPKLPPGSYFVMVEVGMQAFVGKWVLAK